MGVLDGQSVSAAVTNPAFINKNQDDVMPNQLGLTRAFSGPSIADIQQAINNIYSASGVSESTSGTNYNAVTGTITNGQNYQTAFGILAAKFDSATGHMHTGAPGDGPTLPVVRTFAATGNSPIVGDVVLVAGMNIALSQSGQNVTIAATGASTTLAATGNAGLNGDVVLVNGPGITLSQMGQNIEITANGAPGTEIVFYATDPFSSLSGATPPLWNNIVEDTDSAFDNTTGIYTFKTAGKYLLNSSSLIYSQGTFTVNGVLEIDTYYNGGVLYAVQVYLPAISHQTVQAVGQYINASIGDQLYLTINGPAFAIYTGTGTSVGADLNYMTLVKVG